MTTSMSNVHEDSIHTDIPVEEQYLPTSQMFIREKQKLDDSNEKLSLQHCDNEEGGDSRNLQLKNNFDIEEELNPNMYILF